MSSDRARETGPALEAMYQFIIWLVPTVEKFPRSYDQIQCRPG